MSCIKVIIFLWLFFIFRRGVSAHWKCDNGEEINEEWKCDKQTDCSDGSDESPINCPHMLCHEDEFECASGVCLSYGLVCNGYPECGDDDDSDEPENCETLHEQDQQPCNLSTSRQCGDGFCIPLDWLCDGAMDCNDGSDEAVCECPDHHVSCNDSTSPRECIEERWICDGETDCVGGEDERNCKAPPPAASGVCPVDQFECGALCVETEKACDGNADCVNGEDEAENCHRPGCPVRADVTWTNKTIDACHQACRQTPEGPKCFCFPNYRLEPDGFRCRPNGSELPRLYLADDNQIRKLVLSSPAYSEYVVFVDRQNPNTEITALDYVITADHKDAIVWADHQNGNIHLLSGSSHYLLAQVDGLRGLAFDWITRNIYITYKNPNENVGHVGISPKEIYLQSSSTNILYMLQNIHLNSPNSIVVDPEKGKMFVVDEGNYKTPHKLIMAKMDGSNAHTLVEEHTRRILCLAIDYAMNIIYWGEANNNEARIEMMNLDNFQRKTLVNNKDPDVRLKLPTSLTVFLDQLYFSDAKTKEVWKIDSITGKPHGLHHIDALMKTDPRARLGAIVIAHSSVQTPKRENPCVNRRCTSACVLLPVGASCVCQPPMRLASDGRTCYRVVSTAGASPTIVVSTKKTRVKTFSTTSTTTTTTTTATTTLTTTTPTTTSTTTTPTSTSTTTITTTLPTTTTTTVSTTASRTTTEPSTTTVPTTVPATTQTSVQVGSSSTVKPRANSAVIRNSCSKPFQSNGNLIIPANKDIGNVFPEGSSLRYECREGWYIKGTAFSTNVYITCNNESNWFPSPACVPFTCDHSSCGINGRCLKSARSTGAYCLCSNGTVQYTECSTSPVVPTKPPVSSTHTNHSNTGKIVACVVTMLVLTTALVLVAWKCLQKNDYVLLRKNDGPIYNGPSTELDDKIATNGTPVKIADEHKGIKNPNYSSPKRTKMRLSLPDDIDSGVDRSNGSLSSSSDSPGVYNYRCLKASVEADLTDVVDDSLEVLDNTEAKQTPKKQLKSAITSMFALRKTESRECIIPEST